MVQAVSFSLSEKGSLSETCSFEFLNSLNSISFASVIGFYYSLYQTEAFNVLYLMEPMNFIFDRLLPDFSGKPFI